MESYPDKSSKDDPATGTFACVLQIVASMQNADTEKTAACPIISDKVR